MKPRYLCRYPTLLQHRIGQDPDAMFSAWNLPEWMRRLEDAYPKVFRSWWKEVNAEPLLFDLETKRPITLSRLVHPETYEWVASPGLVAHWLLSMQGQEAKERLMELNAHPFLWNGYSMEPFSPKRGDKFALRNLPK